jgi:hypothetical protein
VACSKVKYTFTVYLRSLNNVDGRLSRGLSQYGLPVRYYLKQTNLTLVGECPDTFPSLEWELTLKALRSVRTSGATDSSAPCNIPGSQ